MATKSRASLENRLDALSALRREDNKEKVISALRQGLQEKQNLLVARAAKLVGELGYDELAPELETSFKRLMTNPAKLDPGAQGTEAIVRALLALDYPSSAVFERGLRHVQMESAYGGPIDVAIETRANSAIGFSQCVGVDVVLELVPLLVDPAVAVRIAAARAIGGSGRSEAEAVLRLKVLVGDEEPELILECLAGLLRLSPERSFDTVETFLRSDQAPQRQAAVLALGESRLSRAVQMLKSHERRELDRDVRSSLILALATSRQDEAFNYLLELIAESHLGDALPAIDALVPLLSDSKLETRLEAAIARSEDRRDLERHLERRR